MKKIFEYPTLKKELFNNENIITASNGVETSVEDINNSITNHAVIKAKWDKASDVLVFTN